MKFSYFLIGLFLISFNLNGQINGPLTLGLNNDVGGYIIWLAADGKSGTVAATQDQGSSKWADAADLAKNMANHNAAAKVWNCGWRLPTKEELGWMYNKKGDIGGFTNLGYWSATDGSGPDTKWVQNFNDGTTGNFHNGNTFAVRAVRSFEYYLPCAAPASNATYTIGLNLCLGGYVFQVSADGKHGLVAETRNQETDVIDKFGLPENSTDLVNWDNVAARVNDNCYHTAAAQQFNDWRLPTRAEILLMYAKKDDIGAFYPPWYHTSELNQNASYLQYMMIMAEGKIIEVNASIDKRTRTIRSF